MSNKKYFLNLDGLRAYACLAVLFYHADFPFFGYGGLGVQVFFVISGFLITDILLQSKNEMKTINKIGLYFKRFYYRRVLRIFPIYFLLIFFVSLLVLYKGYDLGDMSYYIFYIQNRILGFEGGKLDFISILGHTWTLAIEEQFYIFRPLLVRLLNKKKLLYFCIFGYIFAVFYRYYAFDQYGGYMLSYSTFSHIDTLLGGAILALLYNNGYSFGKLFKITSLTSILCICLYLLFSKLLNYDLFYAAHISSLEYDWIFFMFIVTPVCISLVNYFLFAKNKLIDSLFNNYYISLLGKMSYGLYLYHLLTYVLVDYLFDRTTVIQFIQSKLLLFNFNLDILLISTYLAAFFLFIIKLGLTIIVSYISYIYVEKKILFYKDRV